MGDPEALQRIRACISVLRRRPLDVPLLAESVDGLIVLGPRLYQGRQFTSLLAPAVLDNGAGHADLVGPLFVNAPPAQVIISVSSRMTKSHGEDVAAFASTIFRAVCTDAFLQHLINSHVDLPVVHLVVNALASLPDRCPTSIRIVDLFPRLVAAVMRNGEPPSQMASILIAKLSRIGHADMVASALLDSGRIDTLWSVIDARVAVRHVSLLYDANRACRLFGIAAGDADVVESLLLRKVLSKREIRVVVDHVRDRGLSTQSFAKVAEAWSSDAFLRQTSVAQQMSVSQALVLLSAIGDGESDMSANGFIMTGVRTRLSHPSAVVRCMGMRVAEQFARRMVPAGGDAPPLAFDRGTLDERALFAEYVAGLGLDLQVVESDTETPRDGATRPDDVRAEVSTGCPGSGPVWTKGDLLADDKGFSSPHQVTVVQPVGNEAVRLPRFVRECYSYLGKRVEGSRDYIEAALRATPDVVRRTTRLDLEPIAVPLAMRLLHLQDQFSTPDFAEHRHDALVAVLICAPELVAPSLADAFYADNYTISDRLVALDVLADGARSLSSTSATDADDRHRRNSLLLPIERLRETPPTVVARIESHTRRWGTTSLARKDISTYASRFGPIAAASFLYPLLLRIDAGDALQFRMETEDTVVLARLLNVVGTIIECAGNCVQSNDMAVTVIKVALWAARNANSVVRSSALFALSRALSVQQPTLLLDEARVHRSEVVSWLANACQGDPDGRVRELASYCLGLLYPGNASS
ncbi:Telomere length regulation protein conserved domain-containing protein [Plasmodiophora brassicae]|uniref:Uncharacterized protein n=1 Tax=Plasmodiophora brassicae TaxID=37360 RepID=A0A0G4IV39_PLABS|nr:hypothetical protein PBRA_007095 [Plasmodiophora brassicae]